MQEVVGVVSCRGGWLTIALEETPKGSRKTYELFHSFSSLLERFQRSSLLAVDIPIGLPSRKERGGREADRQGRKLLGHRSSSLFSPPVRGWLSFEEYEQVRKLGVSRQSFLLWPKIREVDQHMNPPLQERIIEARPELAFAKMHGSPLPYNKKTQRGQEARIALLAEKTEGLFGDAKDFVGELASSTTRKAVGVDDIIDVCALSWVAQKHKRGHAERVPETPPTDQKDLRMEIWY